MNPLQDADRPRSLVTGNLWHLEGGVGEEEVYKGADHADFDEGQDVDARRVPQA
jgi:hypothetical protein